MPHKELTTAAPETSEDSAIQVEVTLPVRPRRPESAKGTQPDSVCVEEASRVPRIARLMALAIKFQEMIDHGEVRDYADLARLGYVTRARLTQIMNLLLLAPDIQERVLFERLTGRSERTLRVVCSEVCWADQRHTLRGAAS